MGFGKKFNGKKILFSLAVLASLSFMACQPKEEVKEVKQEDEKVASPVSDELKTLQDETFELTGNTLKWMMEADHARTEYYFHKCPETFKEFNTISNQIRENGELFRKACYLAMDPKTGNTIKFDELIQKYQGFNESLKEELSKEDKLRIALESTDYDAKAEGELKIAMLRKMVVESTLNEYNVRRALMKKLPACD